MIGMAMFRSPASLRCRAPVAHHFEIWRDQRKALHAAPPAAESPRLLIKNIIFKVKLPSADADMINPPNALTSTASLALRVNNLSEPSAVKQIIVLRVSGRWPSDNRP